MPKSNSLLDKVYYSNQKTYSDQRGNVAYLDGAPLRRPFSMPWAQRVLTLVIVAVAIVLGAVFVNTTVLSSLRDTLNAELMVADNLAREASIETVPVMSECITLSDKKVKKKFTKAGYTVYDASGTGDSSDMVLYKLPADVTEEEAAGYYARGIGQLTAAQATKLLVGSWNFVAERGDVTSMVVRYADFSTGDPQVAVQNALAKQGIDVESIADTGVDESGNTYDAGTLEVGERTCSWRISALPLDDMYSIAGVPQDACYVGVRLTLQ